VEILQKIHKNIVVAICEFKLDEQGEYSALMGADNFE